MPNSFTSKITYLPTEEEIKEATARIRADWDETMWEQRLADDRMKRKSVQTVQIPPLEFRFTLPDLN